MARSNAVGKLRDIVEAVSNGNVSPKAAIHKELGNIADEKVLHSQVLVVTYVGSMYHAGTKIFKTDKALQEGAEIVHDGLESRLQNGQGADRRRCNGKIFFCRGRKRVERSLCRIHNQLDAGRQKNTVRGKNGQS